MRYYFAPMEGITGSLFRRTHLEFFPGISRYYIPFLEPREGKLFDARDRRECDPEENRGIPVLPQLLTNRAGRFLEGAKRLQDLGYTQVNLNLGCPARTVVTKGKGAGALADLLRLECFLEEIFAQSPLPISVKTRLGMEDPSEWEGLLAIYRKFPLTELILHARVLADQYQKPARPEWVLSTLENAPWPVCYNGDLLSPARLTAFQAAYPQVDRVMLGRGLLTNPALVRQAEGGPALTAEELRAFHDTLFARYQALLSGDRNLLCWMKELWFYWACLFPQGGKASKQIRKAQTPAAYRDGVAAILSTPLETEPGYSR